MKAAAARNGAGFYLTSKQKQSHFHRSEFNCKDGCGLQDVAVDLIDALEEGRKIVNDLRFPGSKPIGIHLNSGCRCHRHNENVDGAPQSRHLPRYSTGQVERESGITGAFADAADVGTRRHSPRELFEIFYAVAGFRAMKIYPSWLHVDTRPGDRIVCVNGVDWFKAPATAAECFQ